MAEEKVPAARMIAVRARRNGRAVRRIVRGATFVTTIARDATNPGPTTTAAITDRWSAIVRGRALQRALADNDWLHVFAIEGGGRVTAQRACSEGWRVMAEG